MQGYRMLLEPFIRCTRPTDRSIPAVPLLRVRAAHTLQEETPMPNLASPLGPRTVIKHMVHLRLSCLRPLISLYVSI